MILCEIIDTKKTIGRNYICPILHTVIQVHSITEILVGLRNASNLEFQFGANLEFMDGVKHLNVVAF